MKKIQFILLALVASLGLTSCTYNKLVEQEEVVAQKWADVQTQYQRRADLIPNLVNTVKGYAAHESETLQAVVEARTKATQITVDPTNLTPEKMAEYQAAQGEVSQALGRLLAITEAYPDLKANEQFSELQAQLEGTENRIAESRRLYNEAVQTYNVSVRKFPNNIWAMIFGFEKKTPFAAEAGAEKAPEVQF
jgi:LemA protein